MDFFAKFPDEDECYADLKSIKDTLGRKLSKVDQANKAIKLCMVRDFDVERTNLLKRPDHLKWTGDHEDLQPTRVSQWWIFKRGDFFDGEELVQTQYFQ